MRYRKLRIVWSIFWGLACVLLIVLCVWSYWHADDVTWNSDGNMYGIESAWGSLRPFYNGTGSWPDAWGYRADRIEDSQLSYVHPPFGWDDEYPVYFMAYLPHWLIAIALGVCASAPWVCCRKRFSLRTLLIATTLVAVVLGMNVWLSR
jgi:hypothetical protein